MANTIRKEISVEASAVKPSGKPPHENKTFGLEPGICFYAIEDCYETEKGEETEILFIATKASLKLKQKGEEK